MKTSAMADLLHLMASKMEDKCPDSRYVDGDANDLRRMANRLHNGYLAVNESENNSDFVLLVNETMKNLI